MKATREVLEELALDLGFNSWEHLLIYEESYTENITSHVKKAMMEYAKIALAAVLEDGLGNINTTQSFDDIIENYKDLQLK